MSLFKSTMWLIAAEVVFTLSGYIISAGLGRILGPADYGRYSIIIGFTTMVIIFAGRSVPTAMAKRLSETAADPAKVRAITHTSALIQILIITALTIAFFFAAPLTARIFGDPSLTQLFQLSAFVIPAFALSSFHVLFFNGCKRFSAMTILKMSRGIFRMLWILALALSFGLVGALTGAIVAPLCVFGVALVIDFFSARKNTQSPKRYKLLPFPYPPQKILRYAGGFMLFTLFYEFYVRTDIYLIKALLRDDYATGLYNAAMTVSLIPYYLLFAVTFMLFPTVSDRTTSHGNHGASDLISTALRLVLIVLTPTVVLMYFFATPLITLFFGPSFTTSAALVPFMLGGTFFGTLFYILAAVFNGAGYTRITATIAALAITISIGANSLFLQRYGIVSAAITFSATSFFMGITSLIAARHIFALHIRRATVLRIGIATLCVGYGAHYLTATKFPFIFSAIILFSAYFTLLIAMRELTSADLAKLRPQK